MTSRIERYTYRHHILYGVLTIIKLERTGFEIKHPPMKQHKKREKHHNEFSKEEFKHIV